MEGQHSFGSWLRRRRKAFDLTQAELADQVGCSAATIRKIEAEERRPSAPIVERLAVIFKISPSEQKTFFRFARGDWLYAPTPGIDDAPWRTSSTPSRSNLPAPLTSLIDRGQEVAAVKGYLSDETIRLITLIGPPGIGKTRLSLEVAREAIPNFLDGVFFVALAPLQDPNLVAQSIIQTLGFVETKIRSPIDRLKDGIGDKQMLLVLDNVEHLIENTTRLTIDVLSACPRLKILTTSREALRLPGEWLFPVPALNIPTTAQMQTMNADAIADFSALCLFAERARAARPSFSLNADNLKTIASICTQLDGLPLAIELIAARVRLMSPHSLLSRMSNDFILHADGMRALPERQKTLHNAISWSYDLLPEEEKLLFAHLSVFAGGFTIYAAESALSPARFHKPVPELITSLLDKSLLQSTFDAQGEPRIYMLVTIQQFALARLREWDDERGTRDLHLAYFLELAEKADREIHGSNQVDWIIHLEVEHDNFRAALEWCVASQKTEAALRLLTALAWPWWLRSYSDEVRDWFEKISRLSDVTEYPALFARMLTHLGHQNWLAGDFANARSVLEESRAIWLKLGTGYERYLAETLNFLGMVIRSSDADDCTAQSLYEQSLELFNRCGDQRGVAFVSFNLGWIADTRDQDTPAFSWYERSLALFRQLGDLWGMGRCSQLLGQLFLKQGNLEQARLFFEQHLIIDERLNFRQGIAIALSNLGNLYRYQGNYDQADHYYQRCLVMCREYDLRWDLSTNLFYLGLLALQQANYDRARQHFMAYFELARTMYDGKINTCDLFIGLAAVAAGTHQPERAAKLSGAAQAILDSIDYQIPPFDLAEFNRHIGIARLYLGEALFEILEMEGRHMTPEQAVAYALEDRIPSAASPPDSAKD